MSKKTNVIKVQEKNITIIDHSGLDYISLTDMVGVAEDKSAVIANWLRRRDTIEFLGLWESLNNPNFKPLEFEGLLKQTGTNRFVMSPKQWAEKTGAIGITSKSGKHGGTFAHKDLAFEFGAWISPMFKLYLIKEFQRLKDEEANAHNLEWDYRRFLAKVNYRIHTDAVKEVIIPKYKNHPQFDESYIYAHNAEMLNEAVFGCTAKQWRIEHPQETIRGLNIRDLATIPQNTVLANIESYHATLIKEGLTPKERLDKLKIAATAQLKTLSSYNYTYSIQSPYVSSQSDSNFDNKLKGLLNVPPPPKKGDKK